MLAVDVTDVGLDVGLADLLVRREAVEARDEFVVIAGGARLPARPGRAV
jgi:hypothetical protein